MSIERDSCLQCAIKHISQARVLMLEYRKGYPIHVYFAIGHLAEAEDETLMEYPGIAMRLRLYRLDLEHDHDFKLDWEQMVMEIHNFEKEISRQQLEERGICQNTSDPNS